MRISHVALLVYPRSSCTEPDRVRTVCSSKLFASMYLTMSFLAFHTGIRTGDSVFPQTLSTRKDLFRSEPLSNDYCLMEPWSYSSASLLHTHHRFRGE
ncbi:hypothetical protein F5Y01DRAFT_275560 [Xylaria sp. FL0043]|nr:hypothetical protein F5Y01DRAFT_275560 [Xylaria sp. FL0043]